MSCSSDDSETPMVDPAVVDRLSIALASCGQPSVCCQGDVKLEQPAVVYHRSQAGRTSGALQLPPKQHAALKPLLTACVPASFGRGKKEVVDDNYRKALALPTDRFATNFNLAEHSILAEIKDLLMPEAPRIYARLHKLNIYEPGGFFKEHKDTPQSDDQFGSLVVCLPVPHRGGGLLIKHNRKLQACCKWGTQANARANVIRWAAFYSDCRHQVEPVTSRYRVTLTYELTAEKADTIQVGNGGVQVLRKAAFSKPLFTELKAALDDVTFMPRGGRLGVACNHHYAVGYGSSLCDSMLKGQDAMTFAIASELGLRPKVVFLFNPDEDDYCDRRDYESDDDGYLVLDSYSGDIMQGMCPYEGTSARKVLIEAGAQPANDVVWLNEGTISFRNEHPFMNYGNEPATDTAYSAAAILLRMPKRK